MPAAPDLPHLVLLARLRALRAILQQAHALTEAAVAAGSAAGTGGDLAPVNADYDRAIVEVARLPEAGACGRRALLALAREIQGRRVAALPQLHPRDDWLQLALLLAADPEAALAFDLDSEYARRGK